MKTRIILYFYLVCGIIIYPQQNFWSKLYGPVSGSFYPRVITLTFNQSGFLFAATDRGIFRSFDKGNTWDLVMNGIPQGNDDILCVYSVNNYLFLSEYYDGIYRSSNNGDSWTSKNTGLYATVTCITSNALGYLFAGTSKNSTASGMYRSSNNGENWMSINNGLINTRIRCIAINRNNNYLFVGTEGGGIARSTNNGDNWQQITADSIYNPYSLWVDDINNILYAGFDDPGYHSIMRSTNNGNDWQVLHGNLPQKPRFISNTIITNKKNYIFFADWGSGFFYRSTDLGVTWENISSGLDITTIMSCTIDKEQHLYAGSSTRGVFRTYRPSVPVMDIQPSQLQMVNLTPGILHSEQVQFYNLGTPKLDVSSITSPNSNFTADPTNFQVLTGDFKWVNISFNPPDTGYFQAKFIINNSSLKNPDTLLVTAYVSSPSKIIESNYSNKFELNQNYPNPFNPSTKITYSIPANWKGEMKNVALKVYDILGNEIKALVNEEKSAGTYEVEFSSQALPSGVYYYQLIVGNFLETKKMVLMK